MAARPTSRAADHGPAIAVLQNELLHMRQEIARNREEAAGYAAAASVSRDQMNRTLEQLVTDFNKREGASLLGKTLLLLASGSIGAGIVKLASYFMATPIR